MIKSSMQAVQTAPDHEHIYVSEQLPWYVTATLDAAATRRVRDHLESCAACRDDFERESRLVGALHETCVVDLAPQAALANVMTRIDAYEKRRAFIARLLNPWTGAQAHRSLAFAAVFQAAAIILLTAVLAAVLSRDPPAQEYRTLSNATAHPVTEGPQLRVVFDDQLTTADIRALLDHIDGRIVSGPAAGGIFTVELKEGTTDDAVLWLRAHSGVRLAEIVSN